jgi:CRISPR-associated endonuclease/helicase Cas3
MITLNIQAQEEYLWTGENPAPKTFPDGLLYHQWLTYQAEEPLIVNTVNTGMGKTRAALLRLLKRTQNVRRLSPTRDNALLIAPTNELIMQHVRDACQFCQENSLPYRVRPLTRDALDAWITKYRAAFPGLPVTRRSATLISFLRDGSKLDQDSTSPVDLWVVNPDIFHYIIAFAYNTLDRSQLFNAIFDALNYIIVDEFHYYDAKQLATFLYFMKYSQRQGYLQSPNTRRQFCILTATPHAMVQRYLEHLGERIAWIRPGEVAEQDRDQVRPVRALAPLQLRVYSLDELQKGGQQGGLLQLVQQERARIRQRIGQLEEDEPVEGAIISNSKGTISLIRQALLQGGIDPHQIGSITGADTRGQRDQSQKKALILATPTVDIGYNFDRSYCKRRQNIDLLFFDAYFKDEFFQRMGRAGRVLGKPHQLATSQVYAVVPSACYELLRLADQAMLERSELRAMLEKFPDKNEMSTYLRTGAILGLSLAFSTLSQGMSDEERQEFEGFLYELTALFAGEASISTPRLRQLRSLAQRYEGQQKRYSQLKLIPLRTFELLPDFLRPVNLREKERTLEQLEQICTGIRKPLELFYQRLQDVRQELHHKGVREAVAWLEKDLRQYIIENARLSFREGFQPPQALVYDPGHYHSNEDRALYDALHFVRYYSLAAYPSFEAWHQQTGQNASEQERTDATIYMRLFALRNEPLSVYLKLDRREMTRAQWEERYAYQLTALHGLEIASRDHHGLPHTIQTMFQQQLILAFVTRDDPSCATQSQLRQLQKRARLYPMTLHVAFSGSTSGQKYLILPGSTAFQAYAEIPSWARARDLGRTQCEDESPFLY